MSHESLPKMTQARFCRRSFNFQVPFNATLGFGEYDLKVKESFQFSPMRTSMSQKQLGAGGQRKQSMTLRVSSVKRSCPPATGPLEQKTLVNSYLHL